MTSLLITPLDFGVDLADDTTDQSSGLQDFFDALYTNRATHHGHIWGKARGQNITIKSGIKCHSEGFHLLVPDTAVYYQPLGAFSACFGITNSEALANVQFTGLWSAEGLPGNTDSNGVGGFYFDTFSNCVFGDFAVKTMPQGVGLVRGSDSRAGNIFGNVLRGWQIATRSGTGGSALVISDCSRVQCGWVQTIANWKPAVYFSTTNNHSVNLNCSLAGIIAFSANASDQSLGLAFRSADGVDVGVVHVIGGVLGFKVGGEIGDTTGGGTVPLKRIRIGSAVLDGQITTHDPQPSFIAAASIGSPTGETQPSDVSVGQCSIVNQTSYGLWMGPGTEFSFDLLQIGVNQANQASPPVVRESVTLSESSRLSGSEIHLRDQLTDCIRMENAAELDVRRIAVQPMAAAGKSIIHELNDAGDVTRIRVGVFDLLGSPSGSAYSVGTGITMGSTPMRNVRVGDFIKGNHSVSQAAVLAGWTSGTIAADGFKNGTIIASSMPDLSTTTNFVTGDQFRSSMNDSLFIWDSSRNNFVNAYSVSLQYATTVTIGSDIVSLLPWYRRFTIDTEGGASTDDLKTININPSTAVFDGQIVEFRIANTARHITIKHGTGNIRCPGGSDIVMSDAHNVVVLEYLYADGTWRVISSALNPS